MNTQFTEEFIKSLDLTPGKTFLLVDGNYFGNRTLHGERISNPDFNMSTQGDMMKFDHLMYQNILSLIKSFKNDKRDIIDNIIFAFDNRSWRKSVDPHLPYYLRNELASDEPLKYKENRKKMKEESDVDWENFELSMTHFSKELMQFIPTLNVNGLEGDDTIFALKEILTKAGCNIIIFCTDGDLTQMIDDQTFVFKNVKSKQSPNGEIYMSKKNFELLYGNQSSTDLLSIFQSNQNRTDDDLTRLNIIKHLVDIQVSANYNFNANRKMNEQVFITDKNQLLFKKIVMGDKKDNIFPIFRWKANSRNMSGSNSHIDKTFKRLAIKTKDVDEAYGMIMDYENPDNQDLINTFLINMADITNQKTVAKEIRKHFIHNYKMNVLSEKTIPSEYISDFIEDFKYFLPMIKQDLDYENLEIAISRQNKNLGVADSGNIITQSAPDLDAISSILNGN